MLVLFESAVGLCLFKIKDGKLDDKDLHKQFDSPEGANNLYVHHHLREYKILVFSKAMLED